MSSGSRRVQADASEELHGADRHSTKGHVRKVKPEPLSSGGMQVEPAVEHKRKSVYTAQDEQTDDASTEEADNDYADDNDNDDSSHSSGSHSGNSSSSVSAEPPARRSRRSDSVESDEDGNVGDRDGGAKRAKLVAPQQKLVMGSLRLVAIGRLVFGPRAALFVSHDPLMSKSGIGRFPVDFKARRTFKLDDANRTVLLQILDDEMRGPMFRISGTDIEIERDSMTDAFAAFNELHNSNHRMTAAQFFGFGLKSVAAAYEALVSGTRFAAAPPPPPPSSSSSSTSQKKITWKPKASQELVPEPAQVFKRVASESALPQRKRPSGSGSAGDAAAVDAAAAAAAKKATSKAKTPNKSAPLAVATALKPTPPVVSAVSVLKPTPPVVSAVTVLKPSPPVASVVAAFKPTSTPPHLIPLLTNVVVIDDDAPKLHNNMPLSEALVPLAASRGAEVLNRWVIALLAQDIETVGDVRSITPDAFAHMINKEWCTTMLHSALARIRNTPPPPPPQE
jgi:hypothetical protein